jgi:hypothetical protein
MPKQSELRDHERAERAFAANVRDLRIVCGLSQTDLAARVSDRGLALHQTQVAKIEAGDRGVTIGEAVVLAAILGESLERMVETPIDVAALDLVELRAALQRGAAAATAALKARNEAQQAASVAELEWKSRQLEVIALSDRITEIEQSLPKEDGGVLDLLSALEESLATEAVKQTTRAAKQRPARRAAKKGGNR